MVLTVIIPTYNEAKTLSELVQKVINVPIDKEIIIVDDGSTDNTNEILKQYKSIDNIIIISYKKNRGKGFAIRTAKKHITGDIVIIQDADLETDPNDYLHLIEPIKNTKSKVVYGSRLLNSNIKYNWKYYLGGKLVTFITNLLYNQKITDAPTCYKIFDKELFQSIDIKSNRFEFCPEITAKISKKGFKIKELPMKYYPRTSEEGKKIRLKDGIIAIWTLLKYKFKN